MVHRLTQEQARRIAVRAQLLDAARPADPLAVVRRLGLLQVDLTAHVAPNAELVLWSRLGSSFAPADLDALVVDRSLVEIHGMLRPAEDAALFRAEMDVWPGLEPLHEWQEWVRGWLASNAACREDVLDELRREGPLPARALPDTCRVPWRSSGWSNHKNVVKLLELLEHRGEVAVSSRERRERLWDLAHRVYPDDPPVPLAEAAVERRRRRLAGLGIARAKAPEVPGEPADVGDVGEPAVVDGTKGEWRVDPDQLARSDEPFEGRAALLSPLDRLVMDRRRVRELFGFDYQLEMYKPAVKRRWGYWAMPVLHGDRLVGKLDAEADREAGTLRVSALHLDEPLTPAERADVDDEIAGLAAWLGLQVDDLR